MKQLTCFFICFFLSEVPGFEIPMNGLPEFVEYEDLVELAPGKFQFVEENQRYQRSLPGESGETMEEDDQVTLYSYKVQSTITSRMATTMIQSKLVNNSPQPQNVVFDVQIPKGAFISNFSMTVDGTTFRSSIKEKTVGRALYAQARAKGKMAGLVRSRALDMENFRTEVNVLPGAKVEFELHYQEAKWRKLGSYEHRIYLQPGRLAKHLEVDVWVVEPQGMRFLHVADTFEGHFDGVPVVSKGRQKAHVSFKPTVAQQRICPSCRETAVDGELVVLYDVNREEKAGELEVFNGYFVHFFAPDNLDPIPKNILFVIDVSGSMWGVKMKQVSVPYLQCGEGLPVFFDPLLKMRNHSAGCGELKLSKIQKNVKENIRDNISLFSLGMGFDVDYDFLKRLSNENRGIAQRIYGNQDTSSQLRVTFSSVLFFILRWKSFNYPCLYRLNAVAHACNPRTLEAKPCSISPLFVKYRSLAPTAAAKRKITRSILQMSLDHHIVTPLTSLVIENEAGDERMLADAPPQDPSCCSGALYYGSKVPSGSIPSWASPSPTPVTSMQAEGAKVLESTPPPHVMRVENDPHFIIYLPKSQKNICFNIDSEPGKILNLVSDPESGKIKRNYTCVVAHTCNPSYSGGQGRIKEKVVTITVDKEMSFSVLLHRVWKKHPINVDFLGIYIPPTNKFSPNAHGLIGQFMQEPKIHIFNERPGKDPKKPEASMEVKGQKLIVTRGLQKDYRTDLVFGTDVPCWFVHNSGKGFIDGHYKDYFVPQLYSFLRRP
uniref:Inter-alpha-trypsin inhibitor heavy chain 2 n=1 Tax=Aotus nancymaae TaxID=37293 RepID=A0A2K5D4Z0_AOTNA